MLDNFTNITIVISNFHHSALYIQIYKYVLALQDMTFFLNLKPNTLSIFVKHGLTFLFKTLKFVPEINSSQLSIVLAFYFCNNKHNKLYLN